MFNRPGFAHGAVRRLRPRLDYAYSSGVDRPWTVRLVFRRLGEPEAAVMNSWIDASPSGCNDVRSAGSGPAIPDEGGRLRVVLAAADPDRRDHVKHLLEAGGYDVAVAENGRLALEIVRRGPAPDLVLSGVAMPELDGFGLLAALRADH